MRPITLLGGMLGLLCSLGFLRAQNLSLPEPPSKSPKAQPAASKAKEQSPVIRTITANEVEVRCGASTKFYPTSKLRKQDKVVVLRESPKNKGWLEIKPPRGSFSWINSRFVKRTGRYTGIVVAPADSPVPIRPGSSVVNKTPNVEPVRLKRGTALVILDTNPVQADDGNWLPIEATPQEVRFIPNSAVQGSPKEKAPSISPGSPGSSQDLIARAQRAMKAGQYAQARQLAGQAKDRTDDYQLRLQASYLLNQLTKYGGGQSGSRGQPGHPQYSATNSGNPMQLTSRTSARFPTPGQSPSQSLEPTWSKWGVLRRSRYTHKGQPMWVLVDQRGQVITYAIAAPGKHLRHCDRKMVCLYGTRSLKSDHYLRANYVNVSYVAFPENFGR